jgi:hypothetical protein
MLIDTAEMRRTQRALNYTLTSAFSASQLFLFPAALSAVF